MIIILIAHTGNFDSIFIIELYAIKLRIYRLSKNFGLWGINIWYYRLWYAVVRSGHFVVLLMKGLVALFSNQVPF